MNIINTCTHFYINDEHGDEIKKMASGQWVEWDKLQVVLLFHL